MSKVTIFLRDGQVFALTVDKPIEPTVNFYGGVDQPTMKEYIAALASAKKNAVCVENREWMEVWNHPDCKPDASKCSKSCHSICEKIEEDQLYSLPSEYKMRVEKKCVQNWMPDCPVKVCDCREKVATIYRDQTPKEETQDELWNDVFTLIDDGLETTTYNLLKSKFILTRKEGVTH